MNNNGCFAYNEPRNKDKKGRRNKVYGSWKEQGKGVRCTHEKDARQNIQGEGRVGSDPGNAYDPGISSEV